jgi:RNA polymerase-associated protein
MGSLFNRRSVMTLFSGQSDVYSHQVRFVIAEKVIPADIVEIEPNEKQEEIFSLNPYGTLPIFTDRDLVIYDNPMILMEFFDERFPHPPLLPVYPVARAKMRMMIHRIYKDLFSLYDTILKNDPKSVEKARKNLRDLLIAMTDTFAEKNFFMSEEFTLTDCIITPLLWRLPSLGIELPAMSPISEYAERMFDRESFSLSLTDTERELR